MYISVVFPVADFRSLHADSAGRLEKPRWGETDPQAKFARGFGSIHVRTKSGIGFVGENYYADCDNLLKYPQLIFLKGLIGRERDILAYPINRRFYFDGKMSGRFEFAFRLNEPTIHEIEDLAKVRKEEVKYDAMASANQILMNQVEVNVPDGREIAKRFVHISNDLRDSYLLSSTKNSKINQYDISSVGSLYAAVGAPFVFIRAGSQTPVKALQGARVLYSGDFQILGGRSGAQARDIDSIVLSSKYSLDGETHIERLARLVYIQMRTLTYAHSFYMKQVDAGKFTGSSPLTPAIASMLDRLQKLSPISGDGYDQEVCVAMAKMIANSDIKPAQLAAEVERCFKKSWVSRLLSPVLRYADRKSDVAIGAAASTVTKHVLNGGP